MATNTFVNAREYKVALVYVDDDGTQSPVTYIVVNFSKYNEIYYLRDHLGNIRMSLNKAGEVVGYDDYYPFGEVMQGRSMNSGQPNAINKYNGKELDAETGYANCGARFYDPKIARWLQVDPLADHEKQMGFSPYSAFWNNPVLFIDPTGKCPDCPAEEYVPLAEHVYSANKGDEINGWKVVKVYTEKSGFKAALYEGSGKWNGQHILAFAGTDMTSTADWLNNISQMLSPPSAQYESAVKLANSVSKIDSKTSLKGHSLGGGLASAGARAIGGKAVTFNPASLSPGTKFSSGVTKTADINAYIVAGEPLFLGQASMLMMPEGKLNIIGLSSFSNSLRALMTAGLNGQTAGMGVILAKVPVYLHSMQAVRDAMGVK